jgi:hypothetical protein
MLEEGGEVSSEHGHFADLKQNLGLCNEPSIISGTAAVTWSET